MAIFSVNVTAPLLHIDDPAANEVRVDAGDLGDGDVSVNANFDDNIYYIYTGFKYKYPELAEGLDESITEMQCRALKEKIIGDDSLMEANTTIETDEEEGQRYIWRNVGEPIVEDVTEIVEIDGQSAIWIGGNILAMVMPKTKRVVYTEFLMRKDIIAMLGYIGMTDTEESYALDRYTGNTFPTLSYYKASQSLGKRNIFFWSERLALMLKNSEMGLQTIAYDSDEYATPYYLPYRKRARYTYMEPMEAYVKAGLEMDLDRRNAADDTFPDFKHTEQEDDNVFLGWIEDIRNREENSYADEEGDKRSALLPQLLKEDLMPSDATVKEAFMAYFKPKQLLANDFDSALADLIQVAQDQAVGTYLKGMDEFVHTAPIVYTKGNEDTTYIWHWADKDGDKDIADNNIWYARLIGREEAISYFESVMGELKGIKGINPADIEKVFRNSNAGYKFNLDEDIEAIDSKNAEKYGTRLLYVMGVQDGLCNKLKSYAPMLQFGGNFGGNKTSVINAMTSILRDMNPGSIWQTDGNIELIREGGALIKVAYPNIKRGGKPCLLEIGQLNSDCLATGQKDITPTETVAEKKILGILNSSINKRGWVGAALVDVDDNGNYTEYTDNDKKGGGEFYKSVPFQLSYTMKVTDYNNAVSKTNQTTTDPNEVVEFVLDVKYSLEEALKSMTKRRRRDFRVRKLINACLRIIRDFEQTVAEILYFQYWSNESVFENRMYLQGDGYPHFPRGDIGDTANDDVYFFDKMLCRFIIPYQKAERQEARDWLGRKRYVYRYAWRFYSVELKRLDALADCHLENPVPPGGDTKDRTGNEQNFGNEGVILGEPIKVLRV